MTADSRPGDSDYSLLRARIEWEKANPRPTVLRRAERAVVRGLKCEGLGPQYQVTRQDGFEIAVEGVLIRVTLLPNDGAGA